MSVRVRQRRLQAHDNLIVHTMAKQAGGTVEKAFLEAAMNAADSKAREVRFTMTTTGVVIEDDGRGIRTQRELKEYFQTFGSPHAEDDTGLSTDSRFAYFRIGRGQLFVLGRNIWRTGTFELELDVNTRGLDYDMKTGLPRRKGCRIDITFANPLQAWEVEHTGKRLKELVKWLDLPVYFNGERISADPARHNWEEENDLFWYNSDGMSNVLRIYNDGVFAEELYASKYGLGGTLVTKWKGRVPLNMARNALMRNTDAWKALEAKIVALGRLDLLKKNRGLTESEIEGVWRMLGTRVVTWEQIRNHAIFLTPSGRAYSLLALQRACSATNGGHRLARLDSRNRLRIVTAKKGDASADRLEQNKCALCLDQRLVDWGLDLERLTVQLRDRIVVEDLDMLSEEIDLDFETVDPAEYTAKERRWLLHLGAIARDLEQFVVREILGGYVCGNRTLVVGKNTACGAWTNGSEYIAFSKQTLARYDLMKASDRLAVFSIFLHELLHHRENSATRNTHSEEFYRCFHDAMLSDTVQALFGRLNEAATRASAKIKHHDNV